MSEASEATEPERDDSRYGGDALAGAILLMLFLTVFQRGTGFFRNLMVCRMLESDELGLWNLAQSFLVMAAPLIVFGIPGSFKRYLAYYRQRGHLRTYLRRTTLATCVLVAFGILLTTAFREQVGWLWFGDPQRQSLVLSVAIALLFVIAFNFCVELLTSLREVNAVSFLQLFNSVVFTVASLALIYWYRMSASGVIFGYAVACCLSSVLAGIWIIRSLRRLPCAQTPALRRVPLWGKLVPFAAWLWLADLLANFFGAIDRLMIVHFADGYGHDSLEMIGQYHSSQIIGILLIALTSMLGSVLLSYLSHDWESGQREKALGTLDSALRVIPLLLTWVASIGLIAAPLLFGWVLGDRYVEGLHVLPITMAYCIWFGLLAVAHNYLWCRERAWLVSLTLLVGVVSNVVLNWCWMPRWGLTGAVAGTAVANLLTLASIFGCSHCMGMRYRFSTMLSVIAPALLCLGGWVAFGATTAVIGSGLGTGWLLTASQRGHVFGLLQRWRRRVGWGV